MGFSSSGRRAAAVLSLLSVLLTAGCAVPAGSGGASGELSGASSSQTSPAQSAPQAGSSQTDGVPDEGSGESGHGHTDFGSVEKAGNQGPGFRLFKRSYGSGFSGLRRSEQSDGALCQRFWA